MKKFWNWIRDETNPDARILRLEGAIAEESWFDDEVTPAAFKAELTSGSGPITVWINSPGGDCVAAAQIYNMLMDYPADVTVRIDGIAAGAKSILFGDLGYYWVADRQGRSFKRLNELYAATGQVGFLSSERVDGKLILPEAVKVLAQKAA